MDYFHDVFMALYSLQSPSTFIMQHERSSKLLLLCSKEERKSSSFNVTYSFKLVSLGFPTIET